jgi:hypothetical protein
MMKQIWILLIFVFSNIFAKETQNPLGGESQKNIKVTNKIKPKMLEYHFLKINYSPDIFKLKVNNCQLNPNSSITIPSNQKTMTVRYDYSFANGWRTGAKEITFELDPKSTECNLEFSWDNEWRIVASGATPKKVIRSKYQG